MRTLKALAVTIGALIAIFIICGSIIWAIFYGMINLLKAIAPYLERLPHLPNDYDVYIGPCLLIAMFVAIIYMGVQIVKRDCMDENGKLKWPR